MRSISFPLSAAALAGLLGISCNAAREPESAPSPARPVATESTGQPSSPTKSEPVGGAAHEGCERGAIAQLISAPEDVPTRAELSSTCARPQATLIAIAQDPDGLGLTRLRAIELLGTFRSDSAVAALAKLARREGDLASVRRTALVALGRSTAAGDARRTATAQAALADPDPHVRAAAEKLLAK